ncbi:MAG TPA: hypothetical protein H9679_08910, partial [Firmicutes bacterium]|nr:hypothetical protein [Bacillota bacterium]
KLQHIFLPLHFYTEIIRPDAPRRRALNYPIIEDFQEKVKPFDTAGRYRKRPAPAGADTERLT